MKEITKQKTNQIIHVVNEILNITFLKLVLWYELKTIFLFNYYNKYTPL